MGLFEKKYCDICGNKIGLLGNNKLTDGNMCNECEKKLSVWFKDKDRKGSSIAQIKDQLAQREKNAALLSNFHPTKQIGTDGDKFFLADENMGRFIVLREGEDMKKNPDLLEISKVRDVQVNIVEDKSEERYKDPDGNMVSFHPKHYSYKYKFNVTIDYDGPFFNQIKFPISYTSINGGTDDEKYEGQTLTDELGSKFFGELGIQQTQRQKFVQVDNFGRRTDLPGGYRTDGLTTMKPMDIERYQEYEQIGNEIITCLIGRESNAVSNASPTTEVQSVDELSMLSNKAHIGKDIKAATEYARQAAEMGGDKEKTWYLTLLTENFMEAKNSGNSEAMLHFAEEGERMGSGRLLISLAMPTEPATLEEIEKHLDYCRRAEALGEDVTGVRELAEDQKRMLSPQPAAPTAEEITRQLMEAQQAAMEKARANGAAVMTNPQTGGTAAMANPQAGSAWICSCGVQNTGRFCMECGSPRP